MAEYILMRWLLVVFHYAVWLAELSFLHATLHSDLFYNPTMYQWIISNSRSYASEMILTAHSPTPHFHHFND